MNDNFLIYILILILIALFIFCIGIMMLYLKLLSKFNEIKNKNSSFDSDGHIQQARTKSEKILEDAHYKAREIIAGAGNFLAREEGLLTKNIKNAQEVYTKTYNQAIKATEDRAKQMIQNIPQDIKMTLITVIDNFRVNLSNEVKKSQDEANRTIREAYKEAESRIEEYKKERMSQIDDSIMDVVKNVTERVLGRSISLEEHEKLVHKALEEAKRQKVI